jgi:hypothetical protein
MTKRKLQSDAFPLPELAPYPIDDFIAKLEADGGQDLVAKAVVSMSTLAGLTISDLQKVCETVPAFAKGTWSKVAPLFGLDADKGINQLPNFSVPLVSLPPSFHREVMRNSAIWIDVYQETGSHTREDARVRLMDAVCWRTSVT